MDKTMNKIMVGLLVTILLAGCQAANGATQGAPGGTGYGQAPSSSDMQTRIAANPDMATRFAAGGGPGGPGGFSGNATATLTVTPAPTETPAPTATTVSPTAAAEQAAQDYFAALAKGDFAAAAKSVSAFSLMANKLTSGDVIDALTQEKANGAAWSDLEVKGSQAFTDNTVLVHVTYQLSGLDPKTGKAVQTQMDEEWPLRLENKQWRYNWTNIIDFNTLSEDAKLSNGVTLKPVQITRYSDRISLTVLAQNGTAETVVLGGADNPTLGEFHFGDQTVEAVNTRTILDAWRTVPEMTIDVKGLYTGYPDAIEIVKYKTTHAPSWFTFGLTD
jgi:hypothetical protein